MPRSRRITLLGTTPPNPHIPRLRVHTQGAPAQGQSFPLPGPGRDIQFYPRPPHIDRPAGAFDFDEVAPTSLIAAGGTADLIVVTIPGGYYAAVKWFGQNADDFSIVTWRFLVNTNPVRPFPNLLAQVGTILQPWQPRDTCLVELFANDTFTLRATNTGLVGVNVAARIGGWFWPV